MRNLVRTRSGLQIGIAHVPKPLPMSQDAEKIQKALLFNKRGHEAVPFVCALCIGLLIWVIFGDFDD